MDYFPKSIFCNSFGQTAFELDTGIKYNTNLANESVMFTFDTQNIFLNIVLYMINFKQINI